MKTDWVMICRAVAFALAVAACAFLDWREMAGVTLLLLAVLAYEKSKVLDWMRGEEERRVAEEARRLEELAKLEADLKARQPGQGRTQANQDKERQRWRPRT